MMHAFAQRIFFMFGLRRRLAAPRTPSSLQVDRRLRLMPAPSYFELFRGPQRPCKCRIGIEVREGGFKYIRPIAAEPRTI